MQYQDTGLPQDATVYKAFMMYSKNQALPAPRKPFARDERPAEGATEAPLRMAQIITEAGGKTDPQVLSLALLRHMPKQSWGAVEKSFGHDMVAAIEEVERHNRTSFAYIAEASDKVKLLSMASAILTFEQFAKESAKTAETLSKLSQGETLQPGELMIPVVPNIRIFEKLSEALYDKTSSPELEESFRARLADFRYQNDRLRGMVLESGIASKLDPETLQKLQGDEAGFTRPPAFNETELLDDKKVRQAFDLIVSHPMASPAQIEAAVAAGTLLSKYLDAPNPTAVAGALVLTALRDVNSDHFPFLEKKLDWDVLDLLQDFGGDRDIHPFELQDAPAEFKQFLLANQMGVLDRIKDQVPRLKEIIEQQPDIPETARASVLASNLQQVSMVTERMEETPFMLGDIGAPKLMKAFRTKLDEARKLIEDNMPEGFGGMGFGFRRPTPPRRPGDGKSFDLDA